ncbi:MAG TPA: phosphoribosylglycinamide formyltransferase [Candidatus Limnocylindria bacterium]|nr:phosphoribosylglycinamide formyltransferase [Candidatus Limnocylindria bacterium]
MTLPIAVCVSGRGTNLQALIDAIADGRLDARIVFVASSRKNAPALDRAIAAGIPCRAFPPAANGGRDAAQALMATAIAGEGAELVVLAGYDRILSDAFWDRLGDIPVINIHPSLLPAFGGLGMMGIKVHEAVLAAAQRETGATVHRAHRGLLDAGEILMQRRVPVLPGDDAETLAARVLAVEHELLVEAVRRFAARSPVAS